MITMMMYTILFRDSSSHVCNLSYCLRASAILRRTSSGNVLPAPPEDNDDRYMMMMIVNLPPSLLLYDNKLSSVAGSGASSSICACR